MERKNQKFCLLLASIRADDRVLLSNTFDRVLDLLGPCYAAVVGCRWWVPNSSGPEMNRTRRNIMWFKYELLTLSELEDRAESRCSDIIKIINLQNHLR